MILVLDFIFLAKKAFSIIQEESQGKTVQDELRADMGTLKEISRHRFFSSRVSKPNRCK